MVNAMSSYIALKVFADLIFSLVYTEASQHHHFSFEWERMIMEIASKLLAAREKSSHCLQRYWLACKDTQLSPVLTFNVVSVELRDSGEVGGNEVLKYV